MDNSFPTISYAECVKTNSNGTEYVDLHTAPMSWYEQVESYQNSIVVSSVPFDNWKIELLIRSFL